MKKTHIAVALIVLASLLYYLSMKKPPLEPIIAGTSANFSPFEYKENNKTIGFEMDLLEELASRINRNIEIKDIPFNMLLEELKLNNIQVIASAFSETPERSEILLFTPPYIEYDSLMLISLNKNPAHSVQEFINNGKKIGVLEQRTSDLYVSKIDGIKISRFTSSSELLKALDETKIDGFVLPQTAVQTLFRNYSKEPYSVVELPNTAINYSLAISKEYPHLLAPIAAALENMKRDGTLDLLKQKWGVSQ